MNNEAYPNFKQSLVFVILFLTSFIFFGVVVGLLQVFGWQLSDSYKEVIYAVQSPVCTFPLIIYASRESGIPAKWTVKLPQIHFALLLVLLAISTVIITQPLIYPIEYFRNLIEGKFRFIEFGLPEFNLLIVIKFVSSVVIVPVFEEIFWRKQIFRLLLKKYSPAAAIVLSSVLFACGHFRLHDTGSLFIWGLLFCFVYYKTNSIELSILLHSISNVHSFIVRRVFIDIKEMQFPKYIMITVISAAVIYLIISYLGRYSSGEKDY